MLRNTLYIALENTLDQKITDQSILDEFTVSPEEEMHRFLRWRSDKVSPNYKNLLDTVQN